MTAALFGKTSYPLGVRTCGKIPGVKLLMNKRRFRADDPERKQWQDPDQILASIGLSAGMVFVDIGCGEGYFALPAARRVGPEGKVYASDISEESVAVLREQALAEGLTNLSTEVKPAEETVPCEECADRVFFGIDLHDFNDPLRVLRNARKMLKPSGDLIDLDWKDEPMAFGPPLKKRFSPRKAQGLMEAAGLRVLSVREAGPYHYLITARR
jgi:ubiquinone/menaquinone biosynthesis C-methylase UbiE